MHLEHLAYCFPNCPAETTNEAHFGFSGLYSLGPGLREHKNTDYTNYQSSISTEMGNIWLTGHPTREVYTPSTWK